MKKEVIEKYNWLPVLELLVELVPWAANITGHFSYTWAKALQGMIFLRFCSAGRKWSQNH